MYRILSCFAATAAALAAQSPADLFAKAPPAVDQSLRERIAQFYQLHVDAKFREAEKLVAEDTKDFFYSANKPKYIRFEIRSIEYSAEFTRAKATMVCEQIVPAPGFVNTPIKVPHGSLWKLEGGNWYWYVDMATINRTPFGEMTGGAPGSSGAAPSLATAPTVDTVLSQVVADKSTVKLDPRAGAEDHIKVVNRMPGPARLRLDGVPPPGLEVLIDRPQMKSNEVATVTVRVVKPEVLAERSQVGLVAEPIGKVILIRVDAPKPAPPPEP